MYWICIEQVIVVYWSCIDNWIHPIHHRCIDHQQSGECIFDILKSWLHFVHIVHSILHILHIGHIKQSICSKLHIRHIVWHIEHVIWHIIWHILHIGFGGILLHILHIILHIVHIILHIFWHILHIESMTYCAYSAY